jgi:hypothetical protein
MAFILLTASFGPFERLLQTADLKLEQWLVCLGVSLGIVVVSELRKLLYKHPLDEDDTTPAPGAPAATIDLR